MTTMIGVEEKGKQSLQTSVQRDCEQFNPNKLHDEKCRYCPKYFWVLDRAAQYAEFSGKSIDEVIASWESARTYWYLNFYQDCNQPDLKSSHVEVLSYEN